LSLGQREGAVTIPARGTATLVGAVRERRWACHDCSTPGVAAEPTVTVRSARLDAVRRHWDPDPGHRLDAIEGVVTRMPANGALTVMPVGMYPGLVRVLRLLPSPIAGECG
jgi:hypothetical protein